MSPPKNRPAHADFNYACIACSCGVDKLDHVQYVAICDGCWESLSVSERISIVAQFDQAMAIKNHAHSLSAFGEKLTKAQEAITAAMKELRTAGQEAANLFEEARDDYLKRRDEDNDG